MKVSVITVCYNSVKTIEQTILSVLNQTHENIEYIIIDGGSTDGTVDIIRKYTDRLAYWVSEPDDGIYCAMNKGIVVATGDIVGIINSDDWYAEDAVERAVAAFTEDEKLDLVHGDIVTISCAGDRSFKEGVSAARDSVISLYFHPSMFVKRSVYLKYGVFDEKYKIIADVELMLRFKRLGIQVKKLDKVMAYFRLGGISSSPSHLHWHLKERKRLAAEMRSFYAGATDVLGMIAHQEASFRKNMVMRYLNIRMRRSGDVAIYRGMLASKHKDRYVWWGAGMVGSAVLEYFTHDEGLIGCFVDSDVAKQGHKLGGINVCKPERENLEGAYIVILTGRYSCEIRSELEKMGFVHKRDFMDYSDFVNETILAVLKKWDCLKK